MGFCSCIILKSNFPSDIEPYIRSFFVSIISYAHYNYFNTFILENQSAKPSLSMRSSIFVSALIGVVAASPIALPQDIDIDGIDAANIPVPQGPPVGATLQTPTYNVAAADASASANAVATPVSIASDTPSRRRSVDVNAPCAPQPPGSGTVSNPDTPAGFSADRDYNVSFPHCRCSTYTDPEQNIALNAIVPVGYTQSFSNLAGSISENGYLGLYTLTSFNTIQCQEYCDAAPGCVGINIYIERDPSVNPAAGCPNPTSTINYKCTLYGNQVSAAAATNMGQWRTQYEVVIAGSNGVYTSKRWKNV